ncbi:retrotransposon protein, putative, ty1-copia subclass, partial [Tanacetum coccineum]
MLEREKLSGTNFNDWFRSLRLVLRVVKKLFTIEQPIPPAPIAGKTIGELHAFLIECEKGLPKKATTPQVLTIQGGRIQKPQVAKRKVSKNDVLYFNDVPRDDIYEIDMLNLVLNVNFMYNVRNKRAKLNLDFTHLWHCRLAHISKKGIEKLQHDGLLKSINDESFDRCVSCLFGYPKETMGYYFYLPPENKIVVARYAEFLEKNLISQEASGRVVELEEIKDEDTSPSKNTSENLVKVESFEPPQEDMALVR